MASEWDGAGPTEIGRGKWGTWLQEFHRLIPAVDGCNPQKIRVLGLLKMLGKKKSIFFQMVVN